METEQLLLFDSYVYSFVATRGSIPLYWNQYANIKYKPKIQIVKPELAYLAFNKHFEEQHKKYGSQVIINLVDHKGSEYVFIHFYFHFLQRIASDVP